jgi:hypothetical protein
MQSKTIYILTASIGFALIFQARTADAGFVSVGQATVEGKPSLLEEFRSSSERGTTSVAATARNPGRESPIPLLPQLQESFIRLNGGISPSTGISAPQPELAGGSSMVALALHSHLDEYPMVAWVGAEARSSLPPPMGTRLMRPPRFAG